MSEIVLKGIPAAPGIAYGHTFILDKQEFVVRPRAIMEKEVPIEIARFEESLIKTREEICVIQKNLSSEAGSKHEQIFNAHLLVLEDRTMIEEVVKRIEGEKLSAEYLFSEVLKKYIQIFGTIEDEYLRERVGDVNDVGRRVLKNLMGETKWHDLDNIREEMIVVSHDLSPSDTASMFNKNVIAFVTDIGGPTSHSAIMAKSLGIPAVVGLKDATLRIHNQDFLIVDGRKGLVIIQPTEETKALYRTAQTRIQEFKHQFQEIRDLPSQTTDGHEVTLLANLELPEEMPAIKQHGASGIGLYRTEYFYMNRFDLPSEEEQFEEYKTVVETMAPCEVTIRTLDLGGDKFISSVQIPKDMSPFLGWRAIRFCLARPDIFKTQLRAICRASVYGKIRMMYPMISGLMELRQANALLREVQQELAEEKVPFDASMPVGVMIEVPSAAITADLLAKDADFFSIGTNDLIQYTLAVDRVNEQVADSYQPGHPAVLRLIRQTIEAAHQAHIKVGLCGEMASEPILAFILIGLGIDNLSMSPLSLLQIKKMIRSISMKEAKKVVDEVLKLSTAQEVEDVSLAQLKTIVPQVINMDQKA